ncbi:hypothetical protein NDU88_000692 [Pleurodeles waltl]|uniref:Uncharacterized protein n=1 Tax=Pleurodeles waltl TaxID=8319 RepID=A0AAV7KU43_PLEWA|nr:hypothetical protein NDU88_000692 [Pleurodeles waltl]
MSDKVSRAEPDIKALQAASKKLEEQVQYLTKQSGVMAARLEGQEGRTQRNNNRVVEVPEGAEGPSVDHFLEDLIVNALRPKHQSKFFCVERAHRVLIPQLKPPPPQERSSQEFSTTEIAMLYYKLPVRMETCI